MSIGKYVHSPLFVLIFLSACSTTPPVSKQAPVAGGLRQEHVMELSDKVTVFDEVAFGLGRPLRQYLNEPNAVNGKSVLDLGTGTGVLALIALKNGAQKVVATDINPSAVENARHNAKEAGVDHKMDVRLVSTDNPGAYSVIGGEEKFDLIISNPPQNLLAPKNYFEYSFNDPELAFLRSIIEGLGDHLTPEGKGVFSLYNHSLELVKHIARERGLEVNIRQKTRNRYGDYHVVEISRQRLEITEDADGQTKSPI